MFLEGKEVPKLGSLRDQLQTTVWYRREQRKIVETLVHIYAAMLPINPEVCKKIEASLTDYIDLIIPGSKKYKEQEEANTIKKNADTLNSIFKQLEAHHKGAKIP